MNCKICDREFSGWSGHFRHNHKDISTREYFGDDYIIWSEKDLQDGA